MEWCQVVSQRYLKDRSNETLLLLATSGIANVNYEQAQGVDCEHPPVSQLHPLNPLCATLCFHLGNKLSFYFLSPLVTIPWEQRPCCAYPPSIQHWWQYLPEDQRRFAMTAGIQLCDSIHILTQRDQWITGSRSAHQLRREIRSGEWV